MTSVDRTVTMHEFAYALKLQRGADGLKLLVMRCWMLKTLWLSILNDCGYTIDEVREMAGPLNEYSLLSSLAGSERFVEAIKTDPNRPGFVPDHNCGVVVEVWGQP
jgi:hypothetical protein